MKQPVSAPDVPGWLPAAMPLLFVETVTIPAQAARVALLLTTVIVKAPFVVALQRLHGRLPLLHTELQEDLLLLTIEEPQPAVRLQGAVARLPEAAVPAVHTIAAVLPLLLVATRQAAATVHVPAAVVIPAAVAQAVAEVAEVGEDNKYDN